MAARLSSSTHMNDAATASPESIFDSLTHRGTDSGESNESMVKATSSEAPTRSFDPRPIIATVAMWEDIMGTRRAIQQRLVAIEKADVTPPADMLAIDAHLVEAEKRCKALIRKEWRKHPLAEWAKRIHGLGEHSIAVVVAYLGGSPVVAQPFHWEDNTLVADPPYLRTVGQLRSYCGYGDPDRRRRAGMSQDEVFACGKPLLKARLHLIAESFLKSQSPEYAPLYYEAKAKYQDRDWTDLHKHNAAMRYMIKVFIKDLWLAAS